MGISAAHRKVSLGLRTTQWNAPARLDFYDQPLVYEAFMGTEGFKNPGLRLSWTAPVDFLLQFNFEVFQGVSDESRTFNAVGYSLTGPNGIGTVHSSTAPFVPALYVGSLKTSFDFGDNVFSRGCVGDVRPFDPDLDRHGLQCARHDSCTTEN